MPQYKDAKTAVSITISRENIKFIEKTSQEDKKAKSEIIDEILNAYRKFRLKKSIAAGFKEQTKEDVKEAMLGFNGYLNLIESN
jgi:type I site-specific restriction-modification system R (restriction) subunit